MLMSDVLLLLLLGWWVLLMIGHEALLLAMMHTSTTGSLHTAVRATRSHLPPALLRRDELAKGPLEHIPHVLVAHHKELRIAVRSK